MSPDAHYSWWCIVCGRLFGSHFPGGAYAFTCTHCDSRTPSERVQLRLDYLAAHPYVRP